LAKLVAYWQVNGFCHGTLNSDNFSLLGLTLDSGGGRFIERYDPTFCCDPHDSHRRYAFGQQPRVVHFNLQILSRCLSDVLDAPSRAHCLAQFSPLVNDYLTVFMAQKLGLELAPKHQSHQREQDEALLGQLLSIMTLQGINYHHFLNGIATIINCHSEAMLAELTAELLQYSRHSQCAALTQW